MYPYSSDLATQVLRDQALRAPHLVSHSQRVATVARHIGHLAGLAEADLADLELAGHLHDCGLITIPPLLWTRRGPLTWMERCHLRTHPVRGGDLLRSDSALDAIRWCVYHHHERWDGNGYPSHLAGNEIPLFARIVALAEALVSMVTALPYRAAVTPAEALTNVAHCAGSQFDPDLAALVVAESDLEFDLSAGDRALAQESCGECAA